jgi:hypothetical protein
MTTGGTRVALGDGVPDHSFILPGAAHAVLFVEEPEDMALDTESMIVTDRDGVVSVENWQESA